MTDSVEEHVAQHYGLPGLRDRVFAALESAGKDLNALTVDDLAPMDEFHIRGRAATEELADWANLNPTQRLVDVGCGLGGTSRYLASTIGCKVSGVDLTAEYCDVASALSDRVGLADKTEFRQGSALSLPFEDDSFDIAWTEHVQMNIADKAGFYGEIARVLRPRGRFAFHDVFAGPIGDLEFPVPWASRQEISHLVSLEVLRDELGKAGLAFQRWVDKTDESTAFFEGALRRIESEGRGPLGLHVLMGDDASEKFTNTLRNLRQNRLRVIQAVLVRR